MSVIRQNLQAVQRRIGEAADNAQRPANSIALLAVSKTFGADAVIDAASTGQRAFGENYLQEALDKMTSVQTERPDLKLEWHFIGPIQSNKTRPIATHFDWVHAVDREKIAQRLSDQRPIDMPPLNVCLQVNISGEASKSGLSPDDVPEVARRVAAMPRLRLRGLMAIPEATDDPQQQRVPFRQMHDLFSRLQAEGLPIDTLSMGMSGDLDAAIAEGATIVRIGSAIFGARDYAKQ
ncbi:MAG: YggS family pyridoxal phosphate-dependent enzyme [Oxalicibacterium faecigallinarum]|uniref:Pyridoxal phosphate homeostasis protein n=1 Tax=Oxalicibacterium faecigallinarum TaxID=573741 RepID=A0A8J3AWU9_9BURK|nr:YggS family pyridoxal phosphate-dependent enzyme [Oxalicibacterium faecigallinarum]MDQ7970656.1 YggS family pyridoxal phosphate-dependent enzyme [Oxalicibacterium faecigallinarum]GGI21235.1 YggS family pyridoxal phosphate enzyme [Oxalicibacterium faecigallinarum]